jgi:hypothetical protein
LEAALESAAAGRETEWRDQVLACVEALNEATQQELENADLPESLLSDIARTQPRLRNRVRGIRLQYRQVRQALAAVKTELGGPAAAIDVADTRERLAWVTAGLRYQRARESDLIYEAFYEAFKTDLGDPQT